MNMKADSRAKLKLFKLYLATVLAVAALLDNITTILAISVGAREMNPIVYPFLDNIYLFTLFTVVKVFLAFIVVYRYIEPRTMDIIIYSTILFIFVRATLLNILNYITLLG